MEPRDVKLFPDYMAQQIQGVDINSEAFGNAIAVSLQEDIDVAINSPKGREATECSFNTTMMVGNGCISYELEYNDKRTLDQTPVPNAMKLPQYVMWGLDDSIDGSGAMEVLVKRKMDRYRAEELIGKNKIKLETAMDWDASIFGGWDYSTNYVPDITYSYIKEKVSKRWFNEEGEPLEGKEQGAYKRDVVDRTVCVSRYIGAHRYETVEYPSEYLPIVAMRGDTNYRSDLGDAEYSYSGYYQLLKDIQEQLIYLENEGMSMASKASKVPFMAVEGQLEGYEDDYADYNRADLAVLYYKNITLNGTTAPPPQRMDNSAQVEWIFSYKRDLVFTMEQLVGITPQMMGMSEGARETAQATALRGSAGGLSISAYLDNCEKTIQHSGKVVTDLAIHAKPKRLIKFTPEDADQEVEVEVDLSMLGVSSNDFIYRPTQGPANESKRQAEFDKLLAIAQFAPQDFADMGDLFVKKMGTNPDTEMVERLEQIIGGRNPSLFNKDGKEDPEAVMALEQLSQQLQQAQGMTEQLLSEKEQLGLLINQLQTELQVNKAEAEAKVLAEHVKQTAETERNTQDNQTDLLEAQIKAGQAVDTELVKQDTALQEKELELVGSAIETQSLQEASVNMRSPVKGGVIQTEQGQNPLLEEND